MSLSLTGLLSSVKRKKHQQTVVESIDLSLRQSTYNYYSWLYPKETEAELTYPQKLVINVTKETMQKKTGRMKAVPHLPYIIPKLMRSLRDPDSSVKDYESIIIKDPIMSVAVLKLANSVYFNPTGKRIQHIDTAIVKLGIEGLRSVISAAVMQPIIQKNSAYFSKSGQRLWQHSLNCAVTCEIIAKERKQEPFKVYLLGLIHDIGAITLFCELCKQYAKNQESESPGHNAFVPLMMVLAPAVSYWIAKDWDLPTDICKALAEQVNISNGGQVSEFAHTLYQANFISELYATVYQQNPEKAKQYLSELNLPENIFDQLGNVNTQL